MENIGSEVAAVASPGRLAAQRGLTYALSLRDIWGEVYRRLGIIFIEARSLIRCAPTWKNQPSERIVVTRGVFTNSGEEPIRAASTRIVIEWVDHVCTHTVLRVLGRTIFLGV